MVVASTEALIVLYCKNFIGFEDKLLGKELNAKVYQ
jgi:hypothetical protein